ncbi:hypothetical protein V8F20_010545 [Naviculisporaceae sp. PSN 640]
MAPKSSSRPRADSFIARLKPTDETFKKMLEQIRITNSKCKGHSIMELRKKVSDMCKKHASTPKGNFTNSRIKQEWSESQIKDYNTYKEKSLAIGPAREAGRAAAKEAGQCREKGENQAVQERKLHHAIQQLNVWVRTAIATGAARLEFMVKYCPEAFKAKGANTGHLIAAESALLCAKNAVRKLEHEKRNLAALHERQPKRIPRGQLKAAL